MNSIIADTSNAEHVISSKIVTLVENWVKIEW